MMPLPEPLLNSWPELLLPLMEVSSLKPPGSFSVLIADVDRIVFAIAKVENFWTLCDGREQGVEIWDRAVVQVRRRGPDAVEWPRFVLERSANAVRTKTVHFVAQCGRSRWDLALVPAVHNCVDQLTKCVAEISAVDNLSRVVSDCKVSGDGDRTVFHVFGLGGVGSDVLNIDHVQVQVTLACSITPATIGARSEKAESEVGGRWQPLQCA